MDPELREQGHREIEYQNKKVKKNREILKERRMNFISKQTGCVEKIHASEFKSYICIFNMIVILFCNKKIPQIILTEKINSDSAIHNVNNMVQSRLGQTFLSSHKILLVELLKLCGLIFSNLLLFLRFDTKNVILVSYT